MLKRGIEPRSPNSSPSRLTRRRLRNGLLAAALVLLGAAIAFVTFAPGIVERSMNRVVPVTQKVSPAARALHARLAVADMHADTLLWRRDLNARGTQGQLDAPRLREGGYALQVLSSVSKTPKHQNYAANGADTDALTLLTIAELQPMRTWSSLLARSLWHAEKLTRFTDASNGQLRVIRTVGELDQLLADRANDPRLVGAMLSVEGLHDLEGELANVDTLYAAGFRMAGMAHFFDNEVAGSMHGLKKGGLSALGRRVLRRMEELGMIVDVAHASHRAVGEILALATRPVVSSHGGVQATCKENRNLSDAEIRGIARTGGVIGIGYWEGAVCATEPAAVAKAIAYVRDLVGIDHVGLGSDFDGAVTTGFDASEVVLITQALMDRGFGEAEIAQVMGGNVLRVLRAGIAPRP